MKEQFSLPENYNKSHYENQFIYLSGKNVETLQIQFNKETGRYVKEYEAHRADRLIENEDGLLFEKRTAITTEVLRWILKFGAGAKVLQPESFVEQLKKETEAMWKQYGNEDEEK